MKNLQPVRGTRDIFPEENRRYRHIIEIFRELAENFGFGEISTPIFEFTEVFKRTLGDASDVVTKEMYTFEDRGGDQITLRPEFTAGIVRAFISGGLTQSLPCKFYGTGPMFRYERPQKGRLRQFHQINVELLGVAEPQADVEVISLATAVLGRLGLEDVVTLELNSLGDSASRAAYRDALVAYFSRFRKDLSAESQARLERNPLRILDSKDQGDREIIKDAPVITAYFNSESAANFAAVCEGLDTLGLKYELNPYLVRGLDYYTHATFEFTTTALGAQGTVLAGGRYDNLVEQMGGPPTPGIGWAAGVERLGMLVADVQAPRRPVAIIPLGDKAGAVASQIAFDLRCKGFVVDQAYRGNLARRMRRANRINAAVALILGDDELGRGTATLRDLDSGVQGEVPLDSLEEHLKPHKNKLSKPSSGAAE